MFMLKLAQRESDLLSTVTMKRVSKEERGASEEDAELFLSSTVS